ncbi:MAG TPA: hypothetical protein HA261_01160, partial [Methanosarcina sp.]|nr:hypothetical protein [Methanosarcina sp.]
MKNRFLAILSAFFILMAGSGIGTAAEIVVHPGESIQAAVDNASEGDTILVEPGTYDEKVVVNTQNLIIKSRSGNPDDTIITGNFYLGDDVNLNPVYDGFTFTSNANTWTVCTSGETGCTVQNCKIIHGGLLVDQDSGMDILNTQFIECEYPIMSLTFAYTYIENCKFIDCDGNLPDENYASSVVSKNNVEIHTDPSGKQIVVPIPDYPAEPEPEPTPTEPPADNNTTQPVP